jgi:FMN-dependent NADH-azoreductase
MCNTLDSNSLRGSASYSKQLAEDVIHDLREKNPDASLAARDVEQVSLPHIDDNFVAAASLEPKSSQQSTNDQSVHNHSLWRKFLDAVLEPRTITNKDEIFEYLHYRHDLPPAVLD